ncbi:DUF1360 domain-containing protein [Bradyrhizobium centrolobii]|uniref:DUF1360 domain-containing protein n=1 Tax=Bradyrhizobium centrolobii TaxID=1505087 RepID=UPI003D32153E
MVSQRLRSISSVLGGKNSKEIAGRFARCPFCPSVWAGVVGSVMAPLTPDLFATAAGLADKG